MRLVALVLGLACCGKPAGVTTDAAATDAARDAAAGNPIPPLLKPHSGLELTTMRLVTVVAANDTSATGLFAFSDDLVQSAWWQAARQTFGLGAATSVHYMGPAINADVSQDEMITYLQNAITSGAPAPDGQTLYLLYLPDGVKNSGPVPFTAYHAPFPAPDQGLGDGWAVVQPTSPFGGGETRLQALTRAASHEILEAATDPGWNSWSLDAPPISPWTGSVWQVFQVPGPIESADLCEGSRWFEGSGDEYQRFFSDQRAALGGDPCVPATSDVYYNAGVDRDWVVGTASQTTSIPVTGWSESPVPDWLGLAFVVQASTGFASLVGTRLPLASPLGNEVMPCLGVGMNNGVGATVQVPVPPAAVSGDYAVVEIQTFRVDPQTCYPVPTDDQFHFWLVGVYVM